jgi:hypothetical protein
LIIADVMQAARSGVRELALSTDDIMELRAALENDSRYGRPVEGSFFLLDVWITGQKAAYRPRPASALAAALADDSVVVSMRAA